MQLTLLLKYVLMMVISPIEGETERRKALIYYFDVDRPLVSENKPACLKEYGLDKEEKGGSGRK